MCWREEPNPVNLREERRDEQAEEGVALTVFAVACEQRVGAPEHSP